MALYMYILYRLRDTAHYWFYTSTVFMAAALIALHKFHYKAGRKFNPFTNISSDKFIFEYTNLILTFKCIILHRYAMQQTSMSSALSSNNCRGTVLGCPTCLTV